MTVIYDVFIKEFGDRDLTLYERFLDVEAAEEYVQKLCGERPVIEWRIQCNRQFEENGKTFVETTITAHATTPYSQTQTAASGDRVFQIVEMQPSEIKTGDLLVSPPDRVTSLYSIIGIAENVRKAERDLDANWMPDFYIVDIARLGKDDVGVPFATVYLAFEKAHVLKCVLGG